MNRTKVAPYKKSIRDLGFIPGIEINQKLYDPTKLMDLQSNTTSVKIL